MATVTVPFAQIAQAALALVAKSTVQADDQSIAILGAVKQFLNGVASGQLLVTTAGAEDQPAAGNGAHPPVRRARPPRGAEGVVAP